MSMSQAPLEQKNVEKNDIVDFILKNSIFDNYLSKSYIDILIQRCNEQNKNHFPAIMSALKAMLEYKYVLIKHGYLPDLITKYLEIRYVALEKILTSDAEGLTQFTYNLFHLTEIIARLTRFDSELKKNQDIEVDFFGGVSRAGVLLQDAINDLIQEYFFNCNIEFKDEEFQQLAMCLQYATHITKYNAKEDKLINRMISLANIFFKKTSEWRALANAIISFSGSVELKFIYIKTTPYLWRDVLDQNQNEILLKRFHVVETDKIRLITTIINILSEYLLIFSKNDYEPDYAKQFIKRQYSYLGQIAKKRDMLMALNKSLEYFKDLLAEYNELKNNYLVHCKDRITYQAVTLVLENIYAHIKHTLDTSIITMSNEEMNKILRQLRYVQFAIKWSSKESANMYLAFLQDSLEEFPVESAKICDFSNFVTQFKQSINAFDDSEEKHSDRFSDDEEVNCFSLVNPIPSKIAITDLNGNNNLYSDEQILQIKQLDFKVGERIKKTKLIKEGVAGAAWDIVRTSKDSYVSIYRGFHQNRHLGKGSSGVTKLVQSFNNNYHALKVIHTQKRDSNSTEVRALKKSSQFLGSYFRRNKQGYLQHEILMRLANGVNLETYASRKAKLAPVHWVDIALSAVDSVDELHKRKIVHGDLHLKNCILNLMSSKVNVVDLGMAVIMEEKAEVDVNIVYGISIPYYMANRCMIGRFSYNSDIFSLGIMLAELFSLGFWPNTKDNHRDFHIHSAKQPNPDFIDRLNSEENTENFIQFIQRMISEDVLARPSIAETRNMLTGIRNSYMHSPLSVIHIAYLDLSCYYKCPEEFQLLLVEQLSNKDEVYLVDGDGKYQLKYAEIQQILESQFIFYNRNIIISAEYNLKNVIAKHMQELATDNTNLYHFEYFSLSHVLGEQLTLDEPKSLRLGM